MKLKKGDTYYILKGPGRPYKIHILTIVDGTMVVYKWYGRHKQRWHYEVQRKQILEIEIRHTS